VVGNDQAVDGAEGVIMVTEVWQRLRAFGFQEAFPEEKLNDMLGGGGSKEL
jgi:hypothetical protein